MRNKSLPRCCCACKKSFCFYFQLTCMQRSLLSCISVSSRVVHAHAADALSAMGRVTG